MVYIMVSNKKSEGRNENTADRRRPQDCRIPAEGAAGGDFRGTACLFSARAAGKGGNIRRVAYPLDPRGVDVHPIASPEPHELNRQFLWRFWTRLPRTGHICIFDRTWYGRVMVERLEGFCTEKDWQRAYNEINEFERQLTDWGAVVMKFWIHIDQDTQLARFTDRQNTPEKQWKITEEDWRNREKWPQYEVAVDEMLHKTSTENAPWYIIESNDKKYARIKVLRLIVKKLEKACDEYFSRTMD